MLQYGHRNIGMEGEPQAQALNTLTALLSWQAGHLIDELFCRGSLPLAQAGRKPLPSRSRLLVCHDLAGGYGADRFAQGSSDACQFRLHQWHSIDLFVYFSHRLVAIPPPGWINCAHRHGTLVVMQLLCIVIAWELMLSSAEVSFASTGCDSLVTDQHARKRCQQFEVFQGSCRCSGRSLQSGQPEH